MHLFDKRKLRNAEYIILAIIIVIALFGLLAIIMATASPATGEETSFEDLVSRLNLKYFYKQAGWLILGLAVMAGTSLINYKAYKKIWYFVLAIPVLLILLVSMYGATKGGTTGWFSFGVYTLQPTEMGKLAMILLLANTLTLKDQIYSYKDLLPTFGVLGAFMAVLLYQMDIGTTLVYVFVFLCLLFVSGVKFRLILPLIIAGVIVAILVWFMMGPKQQSRILDYFSGNKAAQLSYSIIAIGSGQFWGKGILGAGAISQLNYIPAVHTDFIFAPIGESFGFIGCLFLILLYAALVIRLWFLMRKIKDKVGSLIIAGVMCMFMFHIFENIGMTIGVMPITGIPLPFVSYGGSSFLTNMIGIGLVESICLNRPLPLFGEG